MSTSFVDAKEPSKNKRDEYEEIEREMYFVPFDIYDEEDEEGFKIQDGSIKQTGESSFEISLIKEETTNDDAPNLDTNTSKLDKIHTVLDIAGFIPAFGAIPDIANGLIYLCEGDFVNMGLSFVAAIPFYGDAIAGVTKGIKYASKTVKKANTNEIVKFTAKKVFSNDIVEQASYIAKTAKENDIKKISLVWTNETKYNAKEIVRAIKQKRPELEIKSLETTTMGIQMEKIVNRALVNNAYPKILKKEIKKAVRVANKENRRLTAKEIDEIKNKAAKKTYDLLKDDRLWNELFQGKGGKEFKELKEAIVEFEKTTSEIYAGKRVTSAEAIQQIKSSKLFELKELNNTSKERFLKSMKDFMDSNPHGITPDYKIRIMQPNGKLGDISKAEESIFGKENPVKDTIEIEINDIIFKTRNPNGSVTFTTINEI